MQTQQSSRKPSPWSWIPSLYFASGLPYVVVMSVSVIMYKRLGISNTDIALYTSWLYLPWVIKPFWSPFVDILRTKRAWIIAMQLLIGAGLGGVALTIPTGDFLETHWPSCGCWPSVQPPTTSPQTGSICWVFPNMTRPGLWVFEVPSIALR